MALSLNKPKLDNLANEIWKSAERLRGKNIKRVKLALHGRLSIRDNLFQTLSPARMRGERYRDRAVLARRCDTSPSPVKFRLFPPLPRQ